MEKGKEDFGKAKDKLEDVKKDIEEFVERVGDIIKKSLKEMYREGKEIADRLAKGEIFYNPNEVEFKPLTPENMKEELEKPLNKYEKLYIGYLFAEFLEEAEAEDIAKFIDAYKKDGENLPKLIDENQKNNKTEREIIDLIKEKILFFAINYKIVEE